MPTENGWEPSPRINPNDPLLVWRTVPGSDVKLQVRNDHAGTAMLAYAADYHAYVEPLVDRMTACYTPTNSVSTSNHLNATAMDFNWDYYPWKRRGNLNGDKLARLRDLLAYWRGIMFWAGDWSDAYVDEMHHQMDYGSYVLERNGQLGQWIKDHIRSDGFSTYRRGGTPAPPPPPAVDAAPVLARATGLSEDRAREILAAVRDGLTQSQCTNPNRIAMWLAQVGHESVSFKYTEEIAKNGRYAPYIGRTWIQITWDYNYRSFSEWCHGKGLVPTADYFVQNYRELADLKWAGIGAAWYWTVARPQINSMCDARDLEGVTKAINGGFNGLDDRRNRYNRALAVGDELLTLTSPSQGDDELSAEAERMIRELYNEYQANRHAPSRSFFAKDQQWGESPLGFQWNMDGNLNELYMTWGYLLGVKSIESAVESIAANGVAPESWAGSMDWLAEVGQQWCQGLIGLRKAMQTAFRGGQPATAPQVDTSGLSAENAWLRAENARLQAAQAVQPAADVELAQLAQLKQEPAVAATGFGQVVGKLYNVVEELRLADSLNIEERATLSATIKILETKNGAQL